MLKIDNLTIYCPDTKLLERVSFSIKCGEKVALVGASGSGKSILAHALLGQCPKGFECSGAVELSADAALIPQSAGYLNPSARIKQQLQAMSASALHYQQIVQCCQLDDDILSKYPGQLSGGMAKRVLIALGLIQDKSLIVADEPTSGLDQVSSQQMLTLLSSATRQEQTLLVISHDIVAVTQYVERLLVFKQGGLVDDILLQENWQQYCHPYSRALWQASPEQWQNKQEQGYVKSA